MSQEIEEMAKRLDVGPDVLKGIIDKLREDPDLADELQELLEDSIDDEAEEDLEALTPDELAAKIEALQKELM